MELSETFCCSCELGFVSISDSQKLDLYSGVPGNIYLQHTFSDYQKLTLCCPFTWNFKHLRYLHCSEESEYSSVTNLFCFSYLIHQKVIIEFR